MKIEEYKTIRSEMLQRFRWTIELAFFAVASTGALLSWLSTKSGEPDLNPYLFICVGLGIVVFVFNSYLNVLQGIYNQGSYLVFFHEVKEQDYNWHVLSRLQKESIGEESNWGRDGRRGGLLSVILVSVNIFGPLWFLKSNLFKLDWFYIVTMIFTAVLIYFVVRITYNLYSTRKFMQENMKEWLQIKENADNDPNFKENLIKRSIVPNKRKIEKITP